MARARSMSEQAFDALQGVRYPKVGDRAQWVGVWDKNLRHQYTAAVKVVRISASGKTIWTRFVLARMAKRHGGGPHRWERWTGDSLYFSYADGPRRGPGGGEMIYGTLYFGFDRHLR